MIIYKSGMFYNPKHEISSKSNNKKIDTWLTLLLYDIDAVIILI